MTVRISVTRKIENYARGIGGVGTVDWQLTLECGHLVIRSSNDLSAFLDEIPCVQCEEKFTKEIEMFQVAEEARIR
jgi:hypothetical protein